MITLVILITITLQLTIAANNCTKSCQSNQLCIEKCEEYTKNVNRNYLSAPHCGLSRLEADVNGVDTQSAQKVAWPWIVSLQYQSAQPVPEARTKKKLRPHFCTGVIISENFILSSAHCIPKEPADYQVMVGSNSLLESDKSAQILEIETILVPGILYKPWVKRHDDFAKEQGRNDDILLIKTATKMEPKIKGNEFVINSICLPEITISLPYKHDWPDKPGGMGHIAGWGYYGVRSEPVSTLMEVQNPFIPNAKASQVLRETRHYFGDLGEYFIYNLTLNEKDLCTMADVQPGVAVRVPWAFNGDSGSPVVQPTNGRAFLLGVSHWISRGQNSLSIWARISYYTEWLRENMNKTLWEL